jgi:FkbM family methyltransferase
MISKTVSAVKALIQRAARRLGYRIVPADASTDRSTMEGAFRALKARGPAFNTVVDIGASTGIWSEALMRHFPSCGYLLIEAQPVHEAALRGFCSRHPNAQFVLAAAGDRKGYIFFDAADPFSGQASHERTEAADIELPVTTVDSEVRARKLNGPFLLKFDTHGFELPILKGAVDTLAKTDVIIMECYNFRIAPECLTFDEMCRHLADLGFRCIDLVDPLYRPYDDAFWQMDLVFVRQTRPEFSYRQYR